MASKTLRRTGVAPEICERFKRHQIESCKEVLSHTPLEVMRLAGLSYDKALALLQSVSKECAPSVTTALELWKQNCDSCFSTSLSELDKRLHGGLPRGTITEVAGPSGCGKTQLCMMLSVLATLPKSMGGLDSGVIYIDTESAFSAERLVEIAQSRFPDYFCSREKVMQMAGRVHVFRELTCQDVLNRVERLEEDIISTKSGLIILDSVASVVRKEFDTSLPGNLTQRSNLLGQEASTLKYLAHEFHIPVVLTNQITTHIGDRGSIPSEEGDSGFVTAALGNTWSHTVNTRLIVQYLDSHQRQIVIAKSPVAACSVLNYTVEKQGICLSGNDEQRSLQYEGTDPGLLPIRVRTGFSAGPRTSPAALSPEEGRPRPPSAALSPEEGRPRPPSAALSPEEGRPRPPSAALSPEEGRPRPPSAALSPEEVRSRRILHRRMLHRSKMAAT